MHKEQSNTKSLFNSIVVSEIWRFSLTFKSLDEIGNEKLTPHLIKNNINKRLLAKLGWTNKNILHDPIYEYLSTKVTECFDSPMFDVKLADYQVKEGSLIVEFYLYLTNIDVNDVKDIKDSIIEYGAIRQAIDYFKKDINFLFQSIAKGANLSCEVIRELISKKEIKSSHIQLENNIQFDNNGSVSQPVHEPPYAPEENNIESKYPTTTNKSYNYPSIPTQMQVTNLRSLTLVLSTIFLVFFLFLAALLDIINIRLPNESNQIKASV
ncbi:hypothetical protein, partial [Photobacterium sp. OFAV2-7]|uniref:hypothetical protein n=1 Tax=Photobacterium sp. OFAV2-7 TaxID=2917748 RepID=UPI001EF7112A